jgi:hypothetical protein
VLRQGEGGGRGEVRRPGKPSAPFIGGERRFEKGRYFPGEAAGELGELRELRPAMRQLGWVSVCSG